MKSEGIRSTRNTRNTDRFKPRADETLALRRRRFSLVKIERDVIRSKCNTLNIDPNRGPVTRRVHVTLLPKIDAEEDKYVQGKNEFESHHRQLQHDTACICTAHSAST